MINVITNGARLLYKRIPYYAVASVSLYVLIFIGDRSYYRFMPASWWIHIQGVPHIDDGQVDGTLTLTFCRETRYPDIMAIGARSFYMILNDHASPAGSYSFSPRIAHTPRCQYISIPASKHPSKPGTYLAHTDLTFLIEGHRKVLSYDTNAFRLSDTRQSLQQQIDTLQEQLKTLQQEQEQLPVATPTQSVSPAVTSPATPSAAINDQSPASSYTPVPAVTGSTPTPVPNRPGVIRSILDLVTVGLL